jgi:aspartyl-tRNA(Asn)/glutamyl-tRNA(Gln) amidotransferase subunit C
MAVDRATVAQIAKLARIRVPERDLEALAGELSNILSWIEQLSELDTEGIAPMTSVVAVELPRRPDAVTDGGYPDRVIGNAPETAPGNSRAFFAVPKVIE